MAYIALFLYILVLGWTPFPLGGAVSWGAGSLEISIAICWLVWIVSGNGAGENRRIGLGALAGPLILAGSAMLWAVAQTLPGVPAGWAHPLWGMASDAIGRALPATVSINPWRTQGEILKLCSSAAAFWLAFCLARDEQRAQILFNAVIVIGVIYAIYGFVLGFSGISQGSLIYTVAIHMSETSGPFMLHNTFATYCGIAFLAALTRLFDLAGNDVVTTKGPRRMSLSLLDFLFGRGLLALLAAVILFAAVVASQSRAGVIAAIAGSLAVCLVMLLGGRSKTWAAIGVVAGLLPLFLLVLGSSDSLGNRYGELLNEGTSENVRLALWQAAARMIGNAPWQGLGLGTFRDAYPLYAANILPFVMDKAHCDYLELAAGLGLPAAAAWIGAIVWLAVLCLRGAIGRRRNKLFSMAAFGAVVLVGTHSAVDFSLQIPAVALSFATLLGIGVAQSARSARPS